MSNNGQEIRSREVLLTSSTCFWGRHIEYNRLPCISEGDYEKLADPVIVYNVGINWLQSGNNSKISLDYQSRPVFNTSLNGDIVETRSARRGMLVIQYQLCF